MTLLKYKGRSSSRTLGVEDFAKMGAEVDSAIKFPRNEAVEVAEDVALAVTESHLVKGEFEIVEAPQPEAQPEEQDDSGQQSLDDDDQVT